MLTALSALLVALPSLARADDGPTFTPTLQVRPRVEFVTDRDGTGGTESMWASHRVRLGMNAKVPHLSARVALQDVRAWGSEAHTLLDYSADGIDLHEGWVQWAPTEAFSLRAGRQEIAVHEHRLLGNVDWTQQGRAFDALTMKARAGIFSTDAGVAVLGDMDAPTAATDALMGFVRAGLAPAEGTTLDLLALVEAQHAEVPVATSPPDRTRATGGLYLQGGSGSLSGRLEAYGQVGTVGDDDILAGMVGARGTWAPEGELEPRVTLWYDLLSGDGDATDGTLEAFDTLYATNHKFYGTLDVMTFTMGGGLDGQGLHDGALKLSMKPVDAVTLFLDGHVFAAAAPVGDTLLGEEADLWCAGTLTKGLVLQGGASMLLYAADLDPEAWAWAQATLEL